MSGTTCPPLNLIPDRHDKSVWDNMRRIQAWASGVCCGCDGEDGGGGDAAAFSVSAGTVSTTLASLVFSNSNNVSFGLNGSTITATATGAGGADGLNRIAVPGTTAPVTATVVFQTGNGITFGLGAGSTVMTASHNALTTQTNQTGNLTATGNTIATNSTSATYAATGIIFAGSGGVSFGVSNGSVVASASTVPLSATTISAVASANAIGTRGSRYALEDHQHAGIHTVSVAGNTAGNTSAGAGSLVLAGGNNITLSGATAAGGMTLSIQADDAGGVAAISAFNNYVWSSTSGIGTSNGTLLVFPLVPGGNPFPGNMTASTVLINCSASITATASSSSHTFSVSIGIYTVSASSTLALLNSASTSWNFAAGTSMSANYHGARWLSIVSSQWSASPTFSADHYYVGLFIRSSNLAVPMSWVGFQHYTSQQRSGWIGSSLATSTTMGWDPFMGVSNASVTALPASIHRSNLNKVHAMAGQIPNIRFENNNSRF